jgi:uridine kinase
MMAHTGRLIIGIVGCSASGKSTLVSALRRAAPYIRSAPTVVTCDDSYKAKASCPVVDLDALPWPRDGGRTPDAFAKRGSADMNHPDAIEWSRVEAEIQRADVSADVVVEGLLLCADHEGAAAVRRLCDLFVVIAVAPEDTSAQEAMWRRKWRREHLGKRSYRERGVLADEYRCYWEHYVWPRWMEHGAATRAMGEVERHASTLKLPAGDAPDASVERLVRWLGEHRR